MSSNERKDMRSTMKSKSKVTMLFVAINERVEGIETTKLKELISHRMGYPDSLEFEIEEVSALKNGQSSGSLITIRFQSFKKACIARNMLNTSNRNADQKIRCFFKREEANGEEAATFQQREVELQKAATEIFETALAVVNDHDNKMKIVRDNIVEVSTQISKYQGDDGSVADFDKLSNEKLALEDKLEELISQKKEFKKYIDSMKTSLTEMSRDNKFDTHLKEVRKSFEIESRRLKTALPMYARREDILNVVRGNQVCVILGETGSGKSTQMVQYLLQAGLAADGLIACTQPRKIAATSLATHVSAEMGSGVGHLIGYQVGLQTKSSAETKVIFMTDHILLNKCLRDRLLTKYSCVLIDEAHERSIHTDLLLGMLKEALVQRPEMKVIITSATIDPDIFVAYFGGKDKCPVLKVSGRTFPVDVIWQLENENDNAFPEEYENKALNKAIEIHQSYTVEQGDILVFLTSAIEIERSVQKMKQRIGEKDLQCLQLHGRLTPEEQQLVFEPTPKGKRKIVFATNSAETSITIPGIKFVVDTGVVKEMKFDAKKNMNCLDVDAVSQSSANQRKGRAGRMASGICYRLYSESDFMKMEKTSNPEILRIQVSQALLKLLELGVDPLNFQYVQSPTPASMKSAMSELRNIGAVEGTRLTELGKWIARMPVEPRLGVFIKKGLDQDIALEALVLASCCNQSGIFFRAGSQEEKKTADLKKIKFCHPGGDLLTMLNVYRDWIQVKDKEKGKWCQNNSINGKAMKGIQEMVKEISSTLKKEMNITLKHSFKSPEVADVLIQKLIFECMKDNVGYYLGHENAGYLIVNRHQRVQLHPSSAILSLGIQPNWVVFNRVLKISADYMTEVTPVPDEMVEEAIKNRSLAVDKEALVNEKVSRVLRLFTGKDVFYKFVGPMHKNRRRIEEEIGQACQGALIIIEADKQRGEVNLYSQPKHTELASAMLRSSLEDVSEYLLRETREECIGNEHSGFRALLREGGAAVEVLMPNQYRSCSILQKSTLGNSDMDEDKIKIILEMSGPVEQIWRPKGKKTSKFWGKVIFVNAADAVSATNRINNDSECGICLEAVNSTEKPKPNSTEKPKPSFQQEYTMKVTWCRRPGKGHCFITTEQKEDDPLLLGKSLSIRGLSVSIQNSKQQSNLYVKGLPVNITEEEIKEGLARALDRPLETCKSRFRVVIPRGNIFSGSDEKQRTQTQLTSLIERYTGPETFRVNMRDIQPKSVTGCAFISFTDLDVCCNTGVAFQRDNAAIFGAKIEVSMEFKSSVYIKKPLYHLIKKDLERVVDVCKLENSSTVIGVREMKSGHVSVEIKATSTQQLATEKAKVDKIVGGDEYECGDKPNFQRLFSWECKQMLRDAGKSFETLILLDRRRMKVTIQGLEENRRRTWAMIEEYTLRANDVLETEVHLKGDDIPPGMIKVLLLKYGLKFEELKKETGISMIQLNLRGHEITIKGKESEVKLALDKIRDLREEMTQGSARAPESEVPDCPICLCPVEDSEIYRLEYCGHTYCKVCVATLVTDAVIERKLPVVCAHEECGKPLVIRDINFQIKIETITIKALLDSALACLTTKENDRFKFCLTPDCDGVYRVSANGEQFTCPLCHTRICTTCHLQYHDGLTCEMYQDAVKRRDAAKDAAEKDDNYSMKKWLDENPAARKLCPKCSAGIEKDGGCNHMTCRCGAHICWKCLEYFSTSRECYDHLSAKHGGCFDY